MNLLNLLRFVTVSQVPEEQWGRLDRLIARLRRLAQDRYGSDSNIAISKLCELTHETVRRYSAHIVFPTDFIYVAKLVKPLGMTGLEGVAYLLGEEEEVSRQISFQEMLDRAELLTEQERTHLISILFEKMRKENEHERLAKEAV